MFAVTYLITDQKNPLFGFRVVMQDFYGFAQLFSLDEAKHEAKQLGSNRQAKVISIIEARRYVRDIVEYYSGRRALVDGKMVVVNESKATYDALRPFLDECRKRCKGRT